jgi:predicted ester cyclase
VFHEVLAEGDRVAIRWTATMTHRGDQLGFPVTGKHVTLEGSTFAVIGNGKIREGWNQMEFQGMIHSLQTAAHDVVKA